MTNEEMALEQSRKYGAPKHKNREEAVYQASVEIAYMKDRQFLELLKRKRDEAANRRDGYDHWSELWTAEHRFACGLNDLINELSGQQDPNHNNH